MKKGNDVFISYRRDNGKDFANAINVMLNSNGFSTFFDLGSVYAGNFRDVIRRETVNSSIFLLIITEGSIDRFRNPEDISRLELETAIENGIPVLPITTIGDEMFVDINKEGSPKCVKELLKYNTRFYTHETQTDTTEYILNLCRKVRESKFTEIEENTKHDVLELVYEIIQVQNQVLNPTICGFNKIDETYLYTGVLRKGKPYGEGTLVNVESKLRYEVNFVGNDSLDGVGKLYEGSELKYEGDLKRLKPHGQGSEYSNGDVYRGIFVNGLRSVKGTLQQSDGTYYEGEFHEGEITGNGYMKDPSGEEYKGEFKRGNREGQGTLITPKGEKYVGVFYNKPTYIQGVKEYQGRVYTGRFNSNLKLDKNVKIYDIENNRILYEGDYSDGIKIGVGSVTLKGDYLTKLNIPEFKIDPIGYSIKFNKDEHYVLQGTYKNDRLQVSGRLHLKDMKGNVIMDKKSSELILYNEGQIEVKSNIINIKEGGNSHLFRYKDNHIGINCVYKVNGIDKKGDLFININNEVEVLTGNGDGFINLGEIEYEIVKINTELPNIIKDKLKDHIERMNDKVISLIKHEGIVIEI